MSKEFNEEQINNAEDSSGGDEYAYKKVIKDKQQRRTWSVGSIILAVLSLVFLFLPWVSLVLGVGSAAAAAVSRKNLGYFDKISLAALIIAIFGIVFAISGIMIMMVNWHNEGFRESPREMAELTARLVTKPLLPYLFEIL